MIRIKQCKNNREFATIHHIIATGLIIWMVQACQKPTQKSLYSYDEVKAKTREISTFGFDLIVPMMELETLMHHYLPMVLFADTTSANAAMHFKVIRKNKVTFQIESGRLVARMPLQIILKPKKAAEQFGLDPNLIGTVTCEIEPKIGIKIALDAHWNATLKLTPLGYTWKKKPTVEMAIFSLDLTPFIDPLLQQHEKEIVQFVENRLSNQWHIKALAEQSWKTLQQPIALTNETKSWIVFSPESISAATPKPTQAGWVWPLQVRGHLDVYLGEKPTIKHAKLPLLHLVDSIQTGLDLTLVNHLPLSEAKKQFLNPWIGKPFEWENGTKKIIIDRIDIHTVPDKIQITVRTTGDVHSVIKFSGKPAFDPQKAEIYLESLQVDIDSTDRQHRWLKPFAEQKIKKNLQEKLRFSLEEKFYELKSGIKTQLFHSELLHNVVIEWQLKDARLAQSFITPEHIIVVLKFTGNLSFKISGS